jgi:sugar phosphate permease
MAMFGGMIAQTPMTLLTDQFGWRNMLFINACAGLVMLGIIFIFVKDAPSEVINMYEHHRPLTPDQFWQMLRQSIVNPQNWLGGLYTSLLNLPIFLMGAMWGSMYLVQVHNLTRTESSFVTSMIFVGTIVGSPVVGWVSDRIGLRRLPMIVCALLSLVTILIVMFTPGLTLIALMALFFAIGFFTSAQIISYPLIAESNPRALTGTSEGLASTLIMAGGISQPVFGWMMGLNWDHKMVDNVPVYSNTDFLTAMAIMPIAFILGLIAALLIKETYCKSYD